MARARFGYDVFLSYNRADKAWVRDLAGRLADTDYNGRPLRPWLDEQVLDPGSLSGEHELTSAMDRSRFFALVLSPSSIASSWVNFELEYFINQRGKSAVLPLLKEECTVPAALSDHPDLTDFTDPGHFEERLATLLATLCPSATVTTDDARRLIDAAVDEAVLADAGGLWPDPTPERDALLAELLKLDIDDPAGEGPALAAFEQAARRMARLIADDAPSAYNMKMLLGECLAAAILRSPGYRQVAQRLIDLEDYQAPDPALFFALVRAISKLAEIDPDRVDASVLVRVASRLDAGPATGPRKAIGVLIGRVIGKIREGDLGQLLIKTLSEMGTISRIAVTAALAMKDVQADSVFYLSEVQQAAVSIAQQGPTAIAPPSTRLVSLLSLLGAGQDRLVYDEVQRAKLDLQKAYGIDDFPYPHFWLDVKPEEAPTHVHNAPFAGRIVKATTRNMVELAKAVNVSNVVCLTEPRVVDALFDNAGALLTTEQDLESPQCRRLRSRSIAFAIIDRQAMEHMREGDHVVVEVGQVVVLKAEKRVRQ